MGHREMIEMEFTDTDYPRCLICGQFGSWEGFDLGSRTFVYFCEHRVEKNESIDDELEELAVWEEKRDQYIGDYHRREAAWLRSLKGRKNAFTCRKASSKRAGCSMTLAIPPAIA